MVREAEEPIEIENDEVDGNDTIEVSDKCLEKPTSIQLRSAIETIMDLNFFVEAEDAQRYTTKISALVENELSKNLKQPSIDDYFGWNL